MQTKPHAPACERNREPILDVLRRAFAGRRHALEIGSGTGQHAVHFAAALPALRWQCTDREPYLEGIGQWLDEAALPNTPPPLALDVDDDWRRALAPALGTTSGMDHASGFDAAFSANSLHIMGWPQVESFFAGLDSVLAPDAAVVAYGPFNRDGRFTSDSNREFDAWLRARDPASGIRDFEAVDALARATGLRLVDDVAMPANNRCLWWTRSDLPPPGAPIR